MCINYLRKSILKMKKFSRKKEHKFYQEFVLVKADASFERNE